MFSPFRLLTLACLALAVYAGFYAVPAGDRDPGSFDPDAVSQYEAAVWQAGVTRQEWSAFVNAVQLQRELHRYSWFRAAQTGFTLSRLAVQFPHMTTARVDRLLPGLEEIARTEQAWKGHAFAPDIVARKQLDWWTAVKTPQRGDAFDRIASAMAEEYALRYGLRADQVYDAVTGRAEAFRLLFGRNADPDWETVTRLLSGSYATLKQTLQRVAEPAF